MDNDSYGAWKIFLYNRHASPEFFSLLEKYYSILDGGTRINNRKGFHNNYPFLNSLKNSDQGTCVQLSRRKDSKVLRFIKNLHTHEVTEVIRIYYYEMMHVCYPVYIFYPQYNMVGLDRGNQVIDMSAGIYVQ